MFTVSFRTDVFLARKEKKMDYGVGMKIKISSLNTSLATGTSVMISWVMDLCIHLHEMVTFDFYQASWLNINTYGQNVDLHVSVHWPLS